MINPKNISKQTPVIAWWSGGVTSAVTCKLCVDYFGHDNVRIVGMDTNNEDPDTYRFKKECEKWYLKKIETIRSKDYKDPKDVWYKTLTLNFATGARCSEILKRTVRERFEAKNSFSYQAFGFDVDEIKRAKSLKLNYPNSRPIFPLISQLLNKKDCIKIIQEANDFFVQITIPRPYTLGFQNNNCFQTGCIQGGIGYWQKIMREFPDKFDAMAKVEHDLTNKKGQPVTMLKDQGKDGGLIFLKKHPKYPHIKDITMMKGRPVKPLLDCNGFCGTNDLQPNETVHELNYQP